MFREARIDCSIKRSKLSRFELGSNLVVLEMETILLVRKS